MKKRNKTIFAFNLSIAMFFTCISLIGYTYCKYCDIERGTISMSIAEPICNLVIDKELTESSNNLKTIFFSVNNYDENGKISDVSMKYYIGFNSEVENNNLNYSLYELKDNKYENLVEIDNSNEKSTTKDEILNTDSKQSKKYKLEISYKDVSKVNKNNKIGLLITLNSEQVKPT